MGNKNYDYTGTEINIGDRVIVGKGKDICFGVITSMDAPSYGGWSWMRVKLEDTNVTTDRRTNQVIKVK